MKKKNIIWASLALIAAAGAALYSFRKGRRNGARYLHKAPQVKINNPGIQNEFPTAPDESKMVK
jgi:hypothetical protein